MTLRSGTCRVSGSLELPYVQQGDADGIPIVLLHAYADSWRSFERLLPHLPRSIRAVAVTQRGHGDATKPRGTYRVGDFVSDLVAFLDVLGLDRVTLVASSSAGFTARMLAAGRPERVAGMVLVGVPWSLRERSSSMGFVETVSTLRDPVDAAFVRDFVEGTSSKHVPRDFLETMIAESLKVPAHVWRGTLDGLLEISPAATHPIVASTLIVWGDRDELAPRGDQERLRTAIPGSRLLVYEGAGHAVHWEQPERVATDVADFVRELDA